MSNTAPLPPWHAPAKRLGEYARSGQLPLSFLIGAGCSVTSGCPSLKEVQEVFEAMPAQQRGDISTGYRFNSEETNRQLEPLFQGASPNIGYYCLASLGRRCKTLVLSLNWDNMIEQAASALEVPCESYDITDNSTEIITCWNELDKGLLVLHLHGKLDDTVRYTQDQTPKLTIDQQSLVNDLLIADRLVVIGASLRYDNDVTAMLRDMNTPEPGYYFNRSDEDTTPGDHATRTIDTVNLFQNRQWVTDDFDFDIFMLLLVSAYREWAYDAPNGNELRSQLSLPRLEDILLPDSFVLRTALANISLHGVTILEGPELVGKTVAGTLLGHCLAICGPGEPCITRSFVGPDHTVGALASDLNATDTASLLLIHPFGEELQLDPNLSLLSTLASRLQKPKGHKLTIIVCCESSKLDTALNQDPSLIDVIARVRLPRKPWFSKDRLTEYAHRHGKHDVADAIKSYEITNPWAVGAWCHGTMPKLDVRIADLERLLGIHEDIAFTSCVAYLSRFVPPIPVSRYADLEKIDVDLLEQFLHISVFEGIQYARVVNSTATTAIENYLRSATKFSQTLRARFPSWRAIAVAMERFNEASKNSLKAVSSGIVLDDLGLTLHLSGASTPDCAVEYIASRHQDWWAVTECCYEIVRRWSTLRQRTGWRIWLESVAAEDVGLYGLLEAALYYGQSTHPELWATVEDRLWQRIGHGQEMSDAVCLYVDAILWRPENMESSLRRWAEHALSVIDEESQYQGIYAFEAAYHAAGFQRLPERTRALATHYINKQQAAFAARMVRWHCAHQSSLRMQQSQFGFHDKAFLCRTLYPEPHDHPAAVVQLINHLKQHPDSVGWGFHAGCRWLDTNAPNEMLIEAATRCLSKATEADLGVVTATLAYPVESHFGDALKTHFSKPAAQTALLDAMREGWKIDGVSVQAPRFDLCNDPLRVHTTVGICFPNLAKSGYLVDWSRFLRSLDDAAAHLLDQNKVDPKILRKILAATESGDLTTVDAVAAARGAENVLQHALEVACIDAKQPQQLF